MKYKKIYFLSNKQCLGSWRGGGGEGREGGPEKDCFPMQSLMFPQPEQSHHQLRTSRYMGENDFRDEALVTGAGEEQQVLDVWELASDILSLYWNWPITFGSMKEQRRITVTCCWAEFSLRVSLVAWLVFNLSAALLDTSTVPVPSTSFAALLISSNVISLAGAPSPISS